MIIDKLKIDISIVIVNYKSWKHLENCLDSINLSVSKDFSLEVIIVDNCSHDDLFEVFKKKFPQLNFIENTGNNGFANGCNLGAKNSNGDFLLFLNPDTIISETALLKIFNYAKGNKNVGIVSCNQRNTNGSYEKNTRFFPDSETLFGSFRAVFKKRLNAKILNKNNVLYPDWVSGAIVFISKTWFDKVNGWNEDFWMYYEDVDLSKKVSKLGAQIVLLTDTEIIHNHGGSSRLNIKTAKITKTELIISKHVYIKNHFKGLKYFILQFLVVLTTVISKLILALLGVFFFFVPKLRFNFYLCIELMTYYLFAIKNRTWLSRKSMKHPNKTN
ncbi:MULTISPECIES: glycosyltransferase family 2 protein [unclassified Polaribacter]|uniref:glycosyltransferase family 2 protein n=1 Tax=unclassified Polaribacter TaxID=196858 RepID=UPI0011BD7636|nr:MULTISPECIES: glycosyltransferase family 2 protein [unclassified Polaribacter]TXD52977.1 glycosyltransferase family 2 protein [Polaribacter sp. IC063]TXD60932.1 glycosyltransferase family 2 protein [Polaribacter sp. IC066]